jgi:hypothetical protein
MASYSGVREPSVRQNGRREQAVRFMVSIRGGTGAHHTRSPRRRGNALPPVGFPFRRAGAAIGAPDERADYSAADVPITFADRNGC